MLLLREEKLLRDMIEAVLDLKTPIRELIILNPDLPTEFPGDKAIVLDVHVRLDDGQHIDLEMQTTAPTGTRPRFLYYWARLFSDSRKHGDGDAEIRPVNSILWFKRRVLAARHFHSVFHLAEDQTHELWSPEFAIHVLELPNLDLAVDGSDARLTRWARFLLAQTDEELDALAHEDPIMTLARTTLEELSADPKAQRLAREREDAEFMHRYLINVNRKEAFAEGEAKGKAEGQRAAIARICETLQIPIDPVRLGAVRAEQLESLLDALLRERRWPEGV